MIRLDQISCIGPPRTNHAPETEAAELGQEQSHHRNSCLQECWTPASQCAGNRNLNKMALQSFFFDCVYLFHVESIKNPCISSRERSQTDKMVDGMDFEELCSDFECISSPYVESIMRQVARDIFELREDNRAFSCYAVPVKYEVFLCYVKSFTFCTLIGSFRLLV
ncbi:uncharacterized protein [Zea mays]|uniref:uncharacterized protein isoform X4 n=1 Tax=Zea mays TaxID=4577 RepID=UPI0009AAC93B|nr:uncharacterized protein LOC100274490 isoform X4 [Zea mays]|eukprot:XP_023156976.1 uncharacterized protein LOC100274490 isoform X4 [Zea mays]